MITGLCVHTSNRLEVLARELATELNDGSVNDPLVPEIILVQSRGMQRWLSLSIARINGICANNRFPFPNAFFEELYSSIDAGATDKDPYSISALAFRLLHLLPDLLQRVEFRPLQRYVAQQPHPLKLFQLAERLAVAFDQYTMFRPAMITAWSGGHALPGPSGGQPWQAFLWRKLIEGIDYPDRARRHKDLIDRLLDSSPVAMLLPQRLFVFGISHLPPFHLQVLEALSRRIPVAMFLLNPCRHYWSDIVSDHQLVKLRSKGRIDAAAELDHLAHYEKGNRLLASLGQQGKHFLDLVHQCSDQEADHFVDNGNDTLLVTIQQDILDLTDGPLAASTHQIALACDGSVQIHSCHSPLREVEVLYDNLLDMLTRNPELTPRDILVMTPDIGRYAPYIHAVFGAGANETTPIPFSVADQVVGQESPCVESFARLLSLPQSRFEISIVLALLENPVLHRRFGLVQADLPQVERWLAAVEIRWGWDAAERKKVGLPALEENSWRQGLDRLLMGHAMYATGEQLFAGVLPYEAMESGSINVLSGLLLFAELLQQTVVNLRTPKDLLQWKTELMQLCDQFFLEDNSSANEMQRLRRFIDDLEKIRFTSAFDGVVPLEIIQFQFKEWAAATVVDSGFFAGGVTFCAMLPMRSIPCPVICLLGLDHDAFPRETHEPGFNLMASEPQPGDRSRRNDDRYLFLEALVSARQVLYLSYVGHDIQDDSERPPSTVVDELTEYINDRYGIEPNKMLTTHALHGFSPVYFNGTDAKLFSYSKQDCAAACSAANPQTTPQFFNEALPAMAAEVTELELADLMAFFAHPVRYLCQHRLGFFFGEMTPPLNDREPFELDHLERYLVNQRLLKAGQNQNAIVDSYSILRSGSWLPHGTAGSIVHRQQAAEVQDFLDRVKPYMQGPCRKETFKIACGPRSITGTIDHIYPQWRLFSRLGKVRSKDLVSQFVAHLVMNCLRLERLPGPDHENFPDRTCLVGTDHIYRFEPIDDALTLLDRFLRLYSAGMESPLPFFVETSRVFAEKMSSGNNSPATAAKAALRKFVGGEWSVGKPEAEDSYVARCFNNPTNLPPAFEEIALEVFEPVLALLTKVS